MPRVRNDNHRQCPQCGHAYFRVPDTRCKGRGCDVILRGEDAFYHPGWFNPWEHAFRAFTWTNGRWWHFFEPDPKVRAEIGLPPYADARLASPPPEILVHFDVEMRRMYGILPREVPPPPQPSQATRPGAGRSPQPTPRLIRRAAEAEDLVAEWLRWMGFSDARVTPPGADGGVDVTGTGTAGMVVAQVKFEAVPAGRPKLQELFGAGHALGARVFAFVSSAGFTVQAQAWADQVGMALFEFELDGSLTPVNPAAQRLFEG